MPHTTDWRKRWLDAWLHSDLIGIPVTAAGFAIITISFAVYLVIGRVAGLFVGKLLFILALGGLFGVILLLEGRRGETTEGLSRAPAGAARRVLVVANEGLQSHALRDEVCRHGGRQVAEAMIVVPVVGSSRLHLLADDVDKELHTAQKRLDAAVGELRRSGITTAGHVDVAPPAKCLVDGLREFSATDVVMFRGGEPGWDAAETFAERVRAEVGLPVREIMGPLRQDSGGELI